MLSKPPQNKKLKTGSSKARSTNADEGLFDSVSSRMAGPSSKGQSKEEEGYSIHKQKFKAIEEDEQAQIYEIFRRFDYSKKGRVETKELANILRLLQHNIGEDEDSKLRYAIDKKRKGFFVMNDLLSLLTQTQFMEDSQEDLLKSLQDLDNDADGFITVKEMTDHLTKLGEPLNEQEMAQFMQLAIEPNQDRPDLIEINRIAEIMLPKIEVVNALAAGVKVAEDATHVSEKDNES